MPSLQCPDCGERHALDGLAGAAAFRCRGCDRVLKVPEQFRQPAAPAAATGAREVPPAEPPVEPPVPAPRAQRAADLYAAAELPSGDQAVPEAAPARRGAVPLALWLRLAIWVIAVPLGALLVFGVAQALGLLTSRQLLDTFLESGNDRFGAVARLIPFWAVVSAALVHFAVLGLTRRREARGARAPDGDAGQTRRQARREREPARTGS